MVLVFKVMKFTGVGMTVMKFHCLRFMLMVLEG